MTDERRLFDSFGERRQAELMEEIEEHGEPQIPLDYESLRDRAEEKLSDHGFTQIAGSAGSEDTKRENREAMRRWRIVPRMLRDIDDRDMSVEFFGERYRELAAITDPRIGPTGTYQLAVALYDAYLGLQTREVFGSWADDYPGLYDTWADAGERLQPRLSDLSGEVARGGTDFAAAAELACSAVKHGLELPAPFAALDTAAYGDHGADYAVRWAEKTLEQLS